MRRLAIYIRSIDDGRPVHDSNATDTPWHSEARPQAGAVPEQYMQCHTYLFTYALVGACPAGAYYETVVSERRRGVDHDLLMIESSVLPQARWIRMFAAAAGVPYL